jgi:hypothetical protein
MSDSECSDADPEGRASVERWLDAGLPGRRSLAWASDSPTSSESVSASILDIGGAWMSGMGRRPRRLW